MKHYKILAGILVLTLLIVFPACTRQSELPEESVVPYEDWTTDDYLVDVLLNRKPGNWNEDVRFRVFLGQNTWDGDDRFLHFSVENAQGQKLIMDGKEARGNLKLLRAGYDGIHHDWKYYIPSSERYIITLMDEKTVEDFTCIMAGGYHATETNQFFSCDTSGATRIEYSYEEITLSGKEMDYTLGMLAKEYSDTITFHFQGNGESSFIAKRDGSDILVKGKEAPFTIIFPARTIDGVYREGEEREGVPGRWNRLTPVGDEWVLTVDPPSPSPWLWTALGGGVLLVGLAVGVLLLRRKRSAKAPLSETAQPEAPQDPPEDDT